MTRLRQTIARRLKEAQNTAAMLTTFNEVDMTDGHGPAQRSTRTCFEKRHGVKLGFMSFFVKAVIRGPEARARRQRRDRRPGHHLQEPLRHRRRRRHREGPGGAGACATPTPLSLAEIEKGIGALGKKARDGQLALDDLQGGTFTITNGGVYGSLMSTPILNAPQSGILGMHKIQERPMAVDGQVVIRPMMYLALSYDHRIVDGKGAVTFLVARQGTPSKTRSACCWTSRMPVAACSALHLARSGR